MSEPRPKHDRDLPLDALRLCLVLVVVVFHVAMGFSRTTPWWPIVDSHPIPALTGLMVALDGFQLPSLFFVAGYFLVPSLDRRGRLWPFLAGKARRLLAPFAVVFVTLGPIVSYTRHLRLGGERIGFGHYLVEQLRGLLDWRFGTLEGVTTAASASDRIHTWHLWFLPFLFLLVALGAIALVAAKRLGPAPRPPRPSPSGLASLGWLLAAGAAIAAATIAVELAAPMNVWWRLGPLLVLQPSRLPLHVGMFALGVLAARRGWRPGPGSGPALALFAAAFAAGLTALPSYLTSVLYAGGATRATPVIHALLRTGLNVAALGTLTMAFARLEPGARLARWLGRLAPYTMDIYLLHLPVLVALHTLLYLAPIGAAGRFAAIAVGAVAVSAAASRWIVRPRPALAAGGAVALVAALALAFP